MGKELLDLKLQFESMVNDLLLVENKLKSELGPIYDPIIFEIHDKCECLKRQITDLHNDLVQLRDARNEIIPVIIRQQHELSVLKNIQLKVFGDGENDENSDLLNQLANHLTAKTIGATSTLRTLAISTQDDIAESLNLNIDAVCDETQEATPSMQFIPITVEQFDFVPALTKKRATLKQINELYEFIFLDAVKKQKCTPLKVKDLAASGIQVVGQTGTAKIDTLRYLKVLETVPKEGTVKLIDKRFDKPARKRKINKQNFSQTH